MQNRRRYWGRLVWVGITNVALCAFIVSTLIEIRSQFPSVWSMLSSNRHDVFYIVLAVVGLLLEILNRRSAVLVNCGLWLAILLLPMLNFSLLSLAVFAVDSLLYVVPMWQSSKMRGAEKNRPKPGDKVVLTTAPSVLGLPTTEQEAILSIVGEPITLSGYDEDGRAELEFTDSQGIMHFIYAHSTCIKPVK